MRKFSLAGLLLVFAVAAASVLVGFSGNARAAEDKAAGLFLNLANGGTGSAGHALQFVDKMMKRGHPVTVFLNGKAVMIAVKDAPQPTYPVSGKTLQEHLVDLIGQGAKIIVCQVCARGQGVAADNLIDGAVLGKPNLVADTLFDPSYKVISW